MDEPTVPCSCCGGTGGVVKRGVGSGQSEAALLRSELIRVWDIAGSLEGLAAGIYETAGGVISSLVADLENANGRIAERDRLISDLERQLAVHQGWDGDAPDEDQGEEPGKAPGKKDGQPAMTRDEHRLASARFEAARNGGDPGLITKKKRGAQSGHRGVSRSGRTEGTVVFCSRTNSGDLANYVLGQTQGIARLIIRHVSFNRLESRTGVPLYGSAMWRCV